MERAVLIASVAAFVLAAAARAEPAADPVVAARASLAGAAGIDGSAEASRDGALELLLEQLAGEDAEARRRSAAALGALGSERLDGVAQKLAELRKASDVGVAPLVKASREMAPRGSDAALVDALLRLPHADTQAYRTTMHTAGLLAALAHMATTPALEQAVLVAGDHQRVFRTEVTRIMMALGERAVAALTLARRAPSTDVQPWASTILEAMNRRVPGDAVQTRDNQVLADVLRAWGAIDDVDALGVVLSFVNSERDQVREAAREAVALYGSDALGKLREAYANLTGKTPADGWGAAELARALFVAYDRVRLQEIYALLDDGLAKQRAGDLSGAVCAVDRVLAREPTLDRRAEGIPVYMQYARSVEETDRPAALAYFRRALRLAPDAPTAREAESAIAYLEARELLGRGIADTTLLRRAVALDPNNQRARAEIDRLEHATAARNRAVVGWSTAATMLVGAVGASAFFAVRRARPRGTLR